MTTNTNTNTAPALREKLIELIAGYLSGTYHCLRVWEAWHVGTMSQDDFEDVGESDTPAELAEAILAALASAAQPPGDERKAFEHAERASDLTRDEEGDYLNPCVQSAWEGWQARSKFGVSQPPAGWAMEAAHGITANKEQSNEPK